MNQKRKLEIPKDDSASWLSFSKLIGFVIGETLGIYPMEPGFIILCIGEIEDLLNIPKKKYIYTQW